MSRPGRGFEHLGAEVVQGLEQPAVLDELRLAAQATLYVTAQGEVGRARAIHDTGQDLGDVGARKEAQTA